MVLECRVEKWNPESRNNPGSKTGHDPPWATSSLPLHPPPPTPWYHCLWIDSKWKFTLSLAFNRWLTFAFFIWVAVRASAYPSSKCGIDTKITRGFFQSNKNILSFFCTVTTWLSSMADFKRNRNWFCRVHRFSDLHKYAQLRMHWWHVFCTLFFFKALFITSLFHYHLL